MCLLNGPHHSGLTGTWGAEMGCAESASPHPLTYTPVQWADRCIRNVVTDSSNVHLQVTGMRIGSRVGVPLANP